jgi:hypothetical protein
MSCCNCCLLQLQYSFSISFVIQQCSQFTGSMLNLLLQIQQILSCCFHQVGDAVHPSQPPLLALSDYPEPPHAQPMKCLLCKTCSPCLCHVLILTFPATLSHLCLWNASGICIVHVRLSQECILITPAAGWFSSPSSSCQTHPPLLTSALSLALESLWQSAFRAWLADCELLTEVQHQHLTYVSVFSDAFSDLWGQGSKRSTRREEDKGWALFGL